MLAIVHADEQLLTGVDTSQIPVIEIPVVHADVHAGCCEERELLSSGDNEVGHLVRWADNARTFAGKQAGA